MNFYQYLKSLIKERNFTQNAVAHALEMDKAYFSKLVNAKFNYFPSADTLESLSDLLQCTVDERIELYRLAGKMPPELRMAFCSSAKDAKEIYSFVFGGSK